MNLENIKEVHRALMRNIEITGGIFKQKINQVGSLITTHPEDVTKELNELFIDYQEAVILEGKSIFSIVPFIAIFLAIHPFEDGNGRLSRLIFNRMVFDAGYKFVKYISVSKYI
jgi:Fic family protein